MATENHTYNTPGVFPAQATSGTKTSNTVPVTVNPAAPGGVAIGAPTATTLPVTWTASPGATGYVVRWAPTGTTTWTERPPVTALTDTITGLTASTGYDVQVRADGPDATESDWSTVVTGTTTA